MVENSEARNYLQSSIIQRKLNENNKWWSNYVYHFSHITNIAMILNTQKLVSRNLLEETLAELIHENASFDVINGTNQEIKDYVRFYFRPKTPTQYHNEGIRAECQITSLRAHCPVPVFMLFDVSLLDKETTYFTYESLASHYHVQLHQGIESLRKAPFEYIYHDSSTDSNTIRKHRQAEVLVKDVCDLECLSKILCRSKAEYETLIYLLDSDIKELYKDKITYIGNYNIKEITRNSIFMNRHLYIDEITFDSRKTLIYFKNCDSVDRRIKCVWSDKNDSTICEYSNDKFALNYTFSHNPFTFNTKNFLSSHEQIVFKVYLDDSLIYINKFYKNFVTR